MDKSAEILTPRKDIPFYLESVGGISKKKSVMGIPMRVLEPLTAYDEAVLLLKELKAGGRDNIKFKYQTGASLR